MRSYRRAIVWPLAVIAASLALTGCVADKTAEGSRPAILPLDTLADDGERLDKWVRPVRISLVGESAEDQRAHVTAQVAMLRTVTGRRIAMSEGADGNLWLVFGAETPEEALTRHTDVFAPLYSNEAAMAADLEDDGEKEFCRAKRGMNAENRHEIVYAAGLVPAGLGRAQISSCINRLLVTGLGSAGTKPLSEDRSAKPEDHIKKLRSGLEIILLKVWYDERVKPGMTVAEVQPIMNETMQKLIKKP